MPTVRELLSERVKTITSATTMASAGKANAWQSDDLMIWTLSKTTLLKPPRSVGGSPLVNLVLVSKETGEWHATKRTANVLQSVSETTSSITKVDPTYHKVQYAVKMLQAGFNITRKAVLDNVTAPLQVPILGQTEDNEPRGSGSFWDTTVREWLEQAGNDIEQLCIQGDDSLDSGTYPLLSRCDGWDVGTDSGTGAHVVDAAGAKSSFDLYKDMYASMPYQYRSDKRNLKWLVGSSTFINWIDEVHDRTTPAGDAALSGKVPGPFGIEMIEVPFIPEDVSVTEGSDVRSDGTFMWLCDPKNFYAFIRRNIERDCEFLPQTGGGTYQLTLSFEVDAMVKNPGAVVKASDVSVGGTAYSG